MESKEKIDGKTEDEDERVVFHKLENTRGARPGRGERNAVREGGQCYNQGNSQPASSFGTGGLGTARSSGAATSVTTSD